MNKKVVIGSRESKLAVLQSQMVRDYIVCKHPETDVEIIRSIKSSLSQQGFVVSGIMEAVGEFEMEQLSEIFNDPSQFGKTVHHLYLDPEIVLKTL